jgi:prepilin-type N-terminal cleavage/methylation domain-containing protein
MRSRRRSGFSLAEVLVALFVLGALLLPILHMFLSSAGSAGQDSREVRATLLAEELMEHIIAAQRLKRMFMPIPEGPVPDPGPAREVDVEALMARYPGEQGAPLWSTGTSMMGSRMYLAPTANGFRRFLAVTVVSVGRPRGFLITPTLSRVSVRVRFTTPLAAGAIEKDVQLHTLLYSDPAPPREVRP